MHPFRPFPAVSITSERSLAIFTRSCKGSNAVFGRLFENMLKLHNDIYARSIREVPWSSHQDHFVDVGMRLKLEY